MKYAPIGQALFKRNRRNFANQLKPSSVAIFHSNDVMPTNADGTMPFRQSSDLFYLSGVDQEESILLLFPDAKDERMRDISSPKSRPGRCPALRASCGHTSLTRC